MTAKSHPVSASVVDQPAGPIVAHVEMIEAPDSVTFSRASELVKAARIAAGLTPGQPDRDRSTLVGRVVSLHQWGGILGRVEIDEAGEFLLLSLD